MIIGTVAKRETAERRLLRHGTHALGLTLSLLAAACSGGADDAGGKRGASRGTPEAGYTVVAAQPVRLTTDLPGRTSAFETSEVRPQVNGVVLARRFEEGSIVHAGQTLYQIDAALYEAGVEQAQANLSAAEATNRASQARAGRLAPLVKINAVSQQEYTDAQALADQSRAAIAQNQAALKTIRINLRYTRVPAPITGRIGRSAVTTGALVTANQTNPLTTIQRLDPIFVDIQQSSASLLALRRAMIDGGDAPREVTLTLEDGTDYPRAGTLEFAEAVVDPGTGAITLRARFPNPQGLLLPGMFVRAHIVQQTFASAFLVPQQAVSRDAKGHATVLLVGADDKAARNVVRADRTIGANWVVRDGLKPGDRVIVEGLSKIKDHQKVKPVRIDAATER